MPTSSLIVWLEFFLCLVLIGYAGTQLARYGDIIADKTGLGGAWIGLILMATVTSLPELVTGISSVGPLLADVSLLHAVTTMSAIMMTGLAIVGFFTGQRNVCSRAWAGSACSC